MLTLVVSLVLCSQCVGNSEGLANLDNSQQRIGGSKRNSEDLVNAKLHQQNAEDSGQSMEKLLEVVEVEPVKPVFHGTIVRLTLQDGSCHLRMSSNKYPVKHSNGAGSSHQYAVGCADAGGAGGDGGAGANAEGRSNLWQMINYAELEDIYEPDSPVVIRQNASIYLISWSLSPGGALLNTHTVAAPFSKNSQEVSGYVNYNMDVVWRVILPPGENFWRVGAETGVRLQHVTTGKLLTVTSHRYPEPWGEGMREVIAASASVGDGAKAGWTINYYQLPDMAEGLTEQVHEERYGGGTSEKTISSLQAQKNTAAFGTTDMGLLLKAEWALLAMLGKHQEVFDFVQEVLLTDGFSLTSIYNSDVRHPVDGYNLIKRLARSWPKARDALLAKKEVVSEMVMVELEEALHQFPSWEENRVSCAVGLLNIQIYSGLDPTDLIGGQIVDPASGKTFKAATKLTPRDAELVAKVAEEQRRFDAKVSWLAASPQLRKKYKKAVTQHNQLLEDPELLVRKEIHTFPESVDHSIAFARNLTQLLHIGRQNCKPFEATDTGCGLSCISYFYWPEVRQLCQGSQKGLRPAQYDKDTKCELLLMSDPYLRLGPFLLEHKNKAGYYIAQIHDIVSPLEMEAIKKKTHKRMRATPYWIGPKLDSSNERTSKVHYLSERTDNLTFELTKRLELALGFKMYHPGRPYASDNYQIMNYGIGGKIGLHCDSFDNWQNDLGIGGGKFTTAMLYLSNVEAGGRTIFPKLGISVEPEAGSLLYWHLRTSDGSGDTRISHLGCPVVFGDKWIGNKVVRWQEQISTFKCFLPKGTNFEPNDRVVLRQKYSLFQ